MKSIFKDSINKASHGRRETAKEHKSQFYYHQTGGELKSEMPHNFIRISGNERRAKPEAREARAGTKEFSSELPKNVTNIKELQFMQCGSLPLDKSMQIFSEMECPGGPESLAVLSYHQVRRLNKLMGSTVFLEGRGNFPTLEIPLRGLVTLIRSRLEAEPSEGEAGIKVRDIRMNGGAVLHILSRELMTYSDLDLIFRVELSSERHFELAKNAILSSLFDLLPEGVRTETIPTCCMQDAYVGKMVKVNDEGNRWSLFSLGNSLSQRNIEIKFVDCMKRAYEFSVDSFQIVLDSLFLFYNSTERPICEDFYPTVVGESMYGDFLDALSHLHEKRIVTKNPQEIRGGGLLTYCRLLLRGYEPTQPTFPDFEKSMCSRFFMDFPNPDRMREKLENYLSNHMEGSKVVESLHHRYLTILHSVVERTTIYMMDREKQQMLSIIEDLACQFCPFQQRGYFPQHPPTVIYSVPGGNVYYQYVSTCNCRTFVTPASYGDPCPLCVIPSPEWCERFLEWGVRDS